MGTQLDIDDVVAGNPLAERELKELRDKIDELDIYRQKLRLKCKFDKQKIKKLELINENLENKILFGSD